MKKIAVWSLFLLIIFNNIFSQCPDNPSNLYEIEQLYRSGQFAEIFARGSCVHELYNRTKGAKGSLDLRSATEAFFGYYILSCLQLDSKEEAWIATRYLMSNFPRHRRNEASDPPAFVSLLDSIVPFPANRFGLFLGPRQTFASLLAPIAYRTDLDSTRQPSIINRRLIDFGFEWIHNFSYHAAFLTGITEEALSFTNTYVSRKFTAAEPPKENDWRIAFTDNANYVQIPIELQYRFTGRRNSSRRYLSDIFVQGGVFGRALLFSQAKVVAEDWIGNDKRKTSLLTMPLPPPRQELFALGGIAALGYHLDFGNFSLFARLSGQVSWLAINKLRGEYLQSYASLFWKYGISDHYAQRNSLSLVVGVNLHKNYKVKNFMQPLPTTSETIFLPKKSPTKPE